MVMLTSEARHVVEGAVDLVLAIRQPWCLDLLAISRTSAPHAPLIAAAAAYVAGDTTEPWPRAWALDLHRTELAPLRDQLAALGPGGDVAGEVN